MSGSCLLPRLTQQLRCTAKRWQAGTNLAESQLQLCSPILHTHLGHLHNFLHTSSRLFSSSPRKSHAPSKPSFQIRQMSNLPESTVYGGPQSAPTQRFNLRLLQRKYKAGEPITVVTAYDYPSAVHVDSAGIDICLVRNACCQHSALSCTFAFLYAETR